MKIINLTLLWILSAICFVGCYEDKGNYDYKDLISLGLDTIGKNLDAGVTAYQFENFTLDPKVEYAGDAKDLEYLWKIYPQKPAKPEDQTMFDSAKVLSREAVFSEIIYETPGEYYLNLSVTDKVSNTNTYLTVKMRIESSLSRGLCVLDERDGMFDLNVVKSKKLITDLETEREGVVYNVFSNVNAYKVDDGKFLAQAFYYGTSASDFFLFTSGGGYKLDHNTFQVLVDDYSAMFSFSAGLTFAPQAYTSVRSGSPGEYLINDGKVHTMRYMYQEKVFGDRIDGDYVAAPYIVKIPSENSYTLFFDQANKKFVPVSKWGLALNTYESTPGAAFDVNHVDKELVYMEQGYSNYTYAIFKDNGAPNYYLYEADFSDDLATPKEVYDMSGCKGIDENTIFSFGSRGAYCFYASGNNLYRYNYTSGSSENALPAFADETITCMKIFKKDGHTLDGKLLLVATYTTSGEGKLYFLDFNEISGTVNKEGLEKPYTGFGRIKDFVDKE